MQALIVLAHPEPRSYNRHLAALAETTLRSAGATLEWSDLYGMGFDPAEGPRHFSLRKDAERFDAMAEQRHSYERGRLAPEVASEIEKLKRAELVIFQCPLWWFGLPAMLKGWIGRVFAYGLYTSTRRYDRGPFAGKRALMSITAGASADSCAHDGREGDTRLILWPNLFTLYYMGFTVLEPFIVYDVWPAERAGEQAALDARLAAADARWVELLRSIDGAPAVRFNPHEDWDADGRLKPNAPVYSPFIRHRREPILE